MRPVTKVALLSTALAVAGVGGYFLLRKSEKALRQDIIALLPATDIATMQPILNQMSRKELTDVLRLFQLMQKGQQLSDTALKQRLSVISQKYNIFT
jgi:hypothetical protein